MERGLRALWGATLVLVPGALLRARGGDRSRAVQIAARLLGLRHLTEALVLESERRARPRAWMIAADALHAASMVMVAAASPRLRRDALISAGCAAGLIALSLSDA